MYPPHPALQPLQLYLQRLSHKKKSKLAASKEAVQHTFTRFQLSVKQGQASVVSRFQKSSSGVKSMGKKMVRGVRSTFARRRSDKKGKDVADPATLVPLMNPLGVPSPTLTDADVIVGIGARAVDGDGADPGMLTPRRRLGSTSTHSDPGDLDSRGRESCYLLSCIMLAFLLAFLLARSVY